MRVGTIDELQDALKQQMLRGVQVSFGPSASPLRHGQWFVSDGTKQVRGDTLADAFNALLGFQEPLDRIDERPKPAKAVPKPTTSVADLLG